MGGGGKGMGPMHKMRKANILLFDTLMHNKFIRWDA